MHRSTRRSVIDPCAADRHVMRGITTKQRDLFRRHRHGSHHDLARESNAPVHRLSRSPHPAESPHPRPGHRQNRPLQHLQSRIVDRLNAVWRQRFVPAARHSGPDGPHVSVNGAARRACLAARPPARRGAFSFMMFPDLREIIRPSHTPARGLASLDAWLGRAIALRS